MRTTDTWSFIEEAQWEPGALALYPILLERLSYRSLPRLISFQQQINGIIKRSWHSELLNALFLAQPTLGFDPQQYARGISFFIRHGRQQFLKYRNHPDLLHSLLPLPEEFQDAGMLSLCQEAYHQNHPEAKQLPKELLINYQNFPLPLLETREEFEIILPTLTRRCWSDQHVEVLSQSVTT